jgi:hypothetical protein
MMSEKPADVFIKAAIAQGERVGAKALPALERAVFLLSELEVMCDKDGIDSFIARYDADDLTILADLYRTAGANDLANALVELAKQLPRPTESLLSRTNDLVTARSGYDYDAIADVVNRRMTN